MNLMEALRSLDPKQKVKVGTLDGSGYFYCGEVDYLLENMTAFNNELSENAEARVTRAESELKKFIDDCPTIGKWAAEAVKGTNPDLSLKSYEAYLQFWIRNLKTKWSTVITQKQHLQEYVDIPFRRATVEDADPAADPNVKIVMVSGYEQGIFWTTDEADGNQLGITYPGQVEEL